MNEISTGRSRAEHVIGAGAGVRSDLDAEKFRNTQASLAVIMMWVFAGSIGVTLAAIFFAPLITPDWKTLVPMFTLVLGYYFAKSG